MELIKDAQLVKLLNIGDEVTGKIIDRRDTKTKLGDGTVFELELSDGQTLSITDTDKSTKEETVYKTVAIPAGDPVAFFVSEQLERKLKRVKNGTVVNIKYVKDQPTAKGAMKVYEVRA